MARVVLWLPQLAGAGTLRAGWPGSNGSPIGMNAAAGAVAAAVWLDAGAALPGALRDAGALWVAPPLAEDPEPPQPASTPTAMADIVNAASLLVFIRFPAPCDIAGASVARG